MKNRLSIFVASVLALTLSACATSPTDTAGNNTVNNTINNASNIGMSVFKATVDNQCRVEIQKQPMWRAASIAMTEQQQQDIQTRVCGCVSEQAPKQVSLIELGNAAIDTNYRTELATKVVINSLQTCYSSIVGR